MTGSPSGATAAKLPAPPRSRRTAATEIDPDLDPDFPDVVDVELSDAELSFPAARTLTILGSTLTGCRIADDTEAALDAADTHFVDGDFTGRSVASLDRVLFTGCRLGGTDFGGTRLRDVRFDGCVLDLASMRGCRLERVHVSGGRIEGLDLSGAQLTDVTIADVSLLDVGLDGARSERVDLTSADLSDLGDVRAIRGATISEVQAVGLAVRLARAAGVHVDRTAV